MNKRMWGLAAVLLLISGSLLWTNMKMEMGLLHVFTEKEEQAVSPQLEPEKPEVEEIAAEKQPKPLQPAVKEQPQPLQPKLVVEKQAPFLVVIDPGHQAKANTDMEPVGPGATEQKYKVTGGTTGIVTKKPEYVLNLEASLLLKEKLEASGISVMLTRTVHNVDISNRERAEIANDQGADLFVRLHADGSENSSVNGFSVLIPGKDNPYTASIFSESEAAAQSILGKVKQKLPIHDKGIFYRNDMTGFNWSKVPVILLEIGFMTNPQEDQKLSDPVYLEKTIEATAQGINEYVDSIH